MEPWVRVKLEKAKDDMITALEENIEGLEPDAEGLTYGLTAIRLCKKFWVKTFNDLPQKMQLQHDKQQAPSSSGQPPLDPAAVPEEQFHILRNINVSLRAQLKEQNKIARKVFTTIVGTGTTGAQIAAGSAGDNSATAGPNRSLDTIHKQLLEETEKIREELFLLQHSAQGTEFDKKDFSLNDYFRLAEFKLNHAANQVLWNSSSGGGNSIEIDMRIQALQSEHQAKMHRVEKQLEAERITVRSLAKTSRQEVEEVQHQHQAYVKKINQEHTEEIERLVSTHEEELKTVHADYELKITELQHSFTQKLLSQSKDGGDASKALDDLRKQIEKTAGGGGNAGPNLAQLRAGFGSSGVFGQGGSASNGEVMSGAMDVLYDREREQDIHSVWEGESKDTLMAQLQGRRAELEMLLSSHSIQMKARTLEWETALREIIAKYEKELQAAHHQQQTDSAKIESLTKTLETKQGEVDSIKALLVTERQAWEENKQELQREAEDRFQKQKLATTEVQGQLLAAKTELKSLIENQQLEIQQYDERELELTDTVRDLRALIDNRANERHHKEVQTDAVTVLKKGTGIMMVRSGAAAVARGGGEGSIGMMSSDLDPSITADSSSLVPWDDFGSLGGHPMEEGEGDEDVLSLASSAASQKKKKRSNRKPGGVGKPFNQSPKAQSSTTVSPKPQSFNVTPTARALRVGGRKVQSPGAGASLSSSQLSGGGVLGGNSSLAGSKGNEDGKITTEEEEEGTDSTFLTTKNTTETVDPVLDSETANADQQSPLAAEDHAGEKSLRAEGDVDDQEEGGTSTNRRKKLGKLMVSNKYANVKSKLDTKAPSTVPKTPDAKKQETEFITPAEKPSFSTRPGAPSAGRGGTNKYSNIRNKFVKPSEQSFDQPGDESYTSLKLGERRPSAGERRRQKVKEMEMDADGNPKKHLADMDLETFGEEEDQQQQQNSSSSPMKEAMMEEDQQQAMEFGPPEDFTDVIQAIKQAEDMPPSALDLLPKTITEPKFYELLGQMALLAEYATSSAKEHTTLQLVKKLKPLMPIRAWQKLINQQVLPIHPLDVTAVLHYFQEYLIPANTSIHRNRPIEVRLYKQVSEQVRTLSGLARANNIPRTFNDVSWDDLDAWVQDGQNYGSSYISPEASPTKTSDDGKGRRVSPHRSQRDRSICLPPLEVKALIVHSIELLTLCRELNAEIANAPAASMSGTNLPKPPAMMIVSQVQLPSINNPAASGGGYVQAPPTATAAMTSRTPRSHQHLVDTAKLKRDTRVAHLQSHRAHQKKWKNQLMNESGSGPTTTTRDGEGGPAPPLTGWTTTPDHPSADFNSPGPAPGDLSERGGVTTSAGRWNQDRSNAEIQSMVVLNNSPSSSSQRKKSRGGSYTSGSQSARR